MLDEYTTPAENNASPFEEKADKYSKLYYPVVFITLNKLSKKLDVYTSPVLLFIAYLTLGRNRIAEVIPPSSEARVSVTPH